jgi:hypothetical protein
MAAAGQLLTSIFRAERLQRLEPGLFLTNLAPRGLRVWARPTATTTSGSIASGPAERLATGYGCRLPGRGEGTGAQISSPRLGGAVNDRTHQHLHNQRRDW